MTPKIQYLIEFNSRLDAVLFATQDEDSTNSNKSKWDGPYNGPAVKSAIASLRANHDDFVRQAKEKGGAAIEDIIPHFQKTQKKIMSLIKKGDVEKRDLESKDQLNALLFAKQDDNFSTLGNIAKGAATIGALGLAGYGANSLLKKQTGKGLADYAGQLVNKIGSSAGSGVSIVPSMRSSFPSSSVVNSAQNSLYSTPTGLLN
jgi:hypothetical protein